MKFYTGYVFIYTTVTVFKLQINSKKKFQEKRILKKDIKKKESLIGRCAYLGLYGIWFSTAVTVWCLSQTVLYALHSRYTHDSGLMTRELVICLTCIGNESRNRFLDVWHVVIFCSPASRIPNRILRIGSAALRPPIVFSSHFSCFLVVDFALIMSRFRAIEPGEFLIARKQLLSGLLYEGGRYDKWRNRWRFKLFHYDLGERALYPRN